MRVRSSQMVIKRSGSSRAHSSSTATECSSRVRLANSHERSSLHNVHLTVDPSRIWLRRSGRVLSKSWWPPLLLAVFSLSTCAAPATAPRPNPSQPSPSQALRPCGVEDYGFGSGYDRRARDCLWMAFQQGNPATFETTHRTHEGAALIYRVRLDSVHVEVVFEDQSKDANAGTFKYSCSRLERRPKNDSPNESFAAVACTGRGPEVIF
jgi:hypothetical protein